MEINYCHKFTFYESNIMISVCVCSWNDLPFLKILYKSLKRNTKLPYEFIVHDNGSEDGTEQWLIANNIKYSRSDTNEGVAAVNYAVKQAKHPYICDINADMYVLPDWDIEIFKQIQKFKYNKVNKFMISSTLVEPLGNNPEYTIANFGHSAGTFDEESLLLSFLSDASRYRKDNMVQYSHPITMPKDLWDEFGGVDVNYPYGIATDHDIPASAYEVGCRDFIMLGRSRVYHFINQTVRKLPKDKSDNLEVFQKKWGMSVDEFRKRMKIATPYQEVEDGLLSPR